MGMSGQIYTLAALPAGLELRYLFSSGLVLSYNQSGHFTRKKTLLSLLVF